jgi:hypothetical protein
MKSASILRTAALVSAAAALLVLGCSDDPAQPKVTAPRYPETTSPEIVIDNLLLSYQDRNIEQFERLLHEDYIWYHQAGMTPEFCTRSEDINMTLSMFLAVQHAHPNKNLWLDQLKLELEPPRPWNPVTDIGGFACAGCFETMRIYVVTAMTAGGDITYLPSDFIQIFVAPVEVNGTTVYRIIRMDDIHW